jgi:HSP20 family protein
MSSSDKSKAKKRRENRERFFRPRLRDISRRGQGEEIRSSPTRDINYIRSRVGNRERSMLPRVMDDIFDNFRTDIEDVMRPWTSSSLWSWPHPSTELYREGGGGGEVEEAEEMVRIPLYGIVDKGDRYQLEIELPGIEKDKVNVNATKESIEISGEQTEKAEEKRRNYIYNERSYRSFYRSIPIPEEIIPSKVSAKMNNGILQIELPKKMPTKLEEKEATKIEIK